MVLILTPGPSVLGEVLVPPLTSFIHTCFWLTFKIHIKPEQLDLDDRKVAVILP